MSSSHYKAMGGLRYVSGLVKVGQENLVYDPPKKSNLVYDAPKRRTFIPLPAGGPGATEWDSMHAKNPALMAGYFVPGVGTALSLGDAVNSFSKGQILGGLGNLGFAAAGLIGAGGVLRGLGRGGKAALAAAKVSRGRRAIQGVTNAYGAMLPRGVARGMARAGDAAGRFGGKPIPSWLARKGLHLHGGQYLVDKVRYPKLPEVSPERAAYNQRVWGSTPPISRG